MIIVGQEKPSLEDLTHFGVKGMKWGIRKENRTSLSNIGDRLNKKKLPLTRSLVRNGSAFVVAQAAIMGASIFVLNKALEIMLSPIPGGTVGSSFMPPEAAINAAVAIAGAGKVAALIQGGVSAGVTARDLSAIAASDVKRVRSKKK